MSKKKTKTLPKTQNKVVTNVMTGMGFQFQVKRFGNVDYINASEIAKYRPSDKPSADKYPPKFMIREFLSNHAILNYIISWESAHNPKFKGEDILTFKREDRNDVTVITPTTLVNLNSKLVMVERGRYGAIWFRHNLALKLAAYINPGFDVYITDDYINLKLQDMNNAALSNLSREKLRKETKSSHYVLIDAIEEWTRARYPGYDEAQLRSFFADETDMINLIVFGMTAAMWRDYMLKNPEVKGNLRDNATKEQLYLIARLEELDAIYIQSGYDIEDREEKLRKIAEGFGTTKQKLVPTKTESAKPDRSELRARLAKNLYNDIMRGEVQRDNDGQFRDRNGFIRLAWKM